MVHVARIEIVPGIRFAIPEKAMSRRVHDACDERRKLGVNDDLPVLDPALAVVLEDETGPIHTHVRLVERRDAECAVFLEIPLAADAKEPIADQPDDGGQDVLAAEVIATEVAIQRFPNARQIARECANAVKLRGLAALDGAVMVAVLLATLGVDAPCLNRGALAGRDVDRMPCGGDAKRVDTLEGTCISHGLPSAISILERRALRAVSGNPSRHGHVPAQGKKGSGRLDSGTDPAVPTRHDECPSRT